MDNVELRTIIKIADGVSKLERELKAINENILDIAKSLRVISERDDQKKSSDSENYLHEAGKELPNKNIGWVLVWVEDMNAREMDPTPQIAKLCPTNDDVKGFVFHWINQFNAHIYESEDWPFRVVYWKPIPKEVFL